MELVPEDVSPLERCPHFRGCYVQASIHEDVSLLERCPHFSGRLVVYIELYLNSSGNIILLLLTVPSVVLALC